MNLSDKTGPPDEKGTCELPNSHRFMDKKEPSKESPEEATRESLIEISYQVPDNDLTVENPPKTKAIEEVVEPLNHDEYETCRSKLISISHSQPPDANLLTALPGQPDGYLGL